MKKEEEIERIKDLLVFYYFINERLYNKSKSGYIEKENIKIVLRMHHNIPKEECGLIIRGLEILDLIKEDGIYYKVKKPSRQRDDMILDYKKRLGLV